MTPSKGQLSKFAILGRKARDLTKMLLDTVEKKNSCGQSSVEGEAVQYCGGQQKGFKNMPIAKSTAETTLAHYRMRTITSHTGTQTR